ncbi:MAG: hypothetical protein ACRBM6_29430, partial [Geminicoccales bacterium]
ANKGPNRLHQYRMVSWQMSMPCASYKFDRIEILDFSQCSLKHHPHGYVGHFGSGMAEILLPVAA